MEELIEALQILSKYGCPQFPTHCEHDTLYVNINPDLVSADDLNRLEQLHFSPDNNNPMFKSTNFGSC